jgi:hypothetical protein
VPVGMRTQLPKTSLWNPTGHEGNICPSASFMLKGCVVMNTVNNIVAATIAATAALLSVIVLSF